MDASTFTTLVQALQITVATSLIFLGGTCCSQYSLSRHYKAILSCHLSPSPRFKPSRFKLDETRALALSHSWAQPRATLRAAIFRLHTLTQPGLSSCLSLWVIPLASLLPAQQACRQFTQTVTWGFQYLQPSSRILGVSLLLTTLLTFQLPGEESETWKTWATALAILVPVAPYEVYFIFPINDRVKEIGRELSTGEEEKSVKKELDALLRTWKIRNWGRVLAPLVAGVVGWMGVVGR
jgi:hypothetical protein